MLSKPEQLNWVSKNEKLTAIYRIPKDVSPSIDSLLLSGGN